MGCTSSAAVKTLDDQQIKNPYPEQASAEIVFKEDGHDDTREDQRRSSKGDGKGRGSKGDGKGQGHRHREDAVGDDDVREDQRRSSKGDSKGRGHRHSHGKGKGKSRGVHDEPLSLPPNIKPCPACGMLLERVSGSDEMMCGCEARPAGGTLEKALAGGGCGHEFNWTTLEPINCGRPGAPANDRQVKFQVKEQRRSTPTALADLPLDPKRVPHYWANQNLAGPDFDEFFLVGDEHLRKFDEFLQASYVAVATQDRPCPTGVCKKTPKGCACVQFYPKDIVADLPAHVPGLPHGYRARKVIRNEDSIMWSRYQAKKKEICSNRNNDTHLRQFQPPVLTTAVADKFSDIFAPLDKNYNEAYLLHGTTVEAALAIAEDDFQINLAGSAGGTMYGRGVYMAESVTKADEYAKDSSDPKYAGVFALVVCRVIMGKMYYTTTRKEEAEDIVDTGKYDSTLGDRARHAGTYREFVAYSNEQIYPEYVILYHRVLMRDDPTQVEAKLKQPLKVNLPLKDKASKGRK